MPKNVDGFRRGMTIKEDYKHALDIASAKLTLALDRKVNATDVLYELIDEYLEQAIESYQAKNS
ncbi:MAG: hypothetical protein ISP86_01795 [Shewanellaceae bacterium]|nr:hypothetical protein [Shewanellaceae bacterium]